MKTTLLYFAVLLTMNVSSQTVRDPSAYASAIIANELKTNLYIIASDSMQGRETAMPGQHKAADFIEKEFRSLGLLPGWNGHFQQTFPVFRDSIETAVLRINSRTLRKDSDFIVSGNSFATISLSAKEVLFVGYGESDSIRDDYKGVNAKGKIVLILPGRPLLKVKRQKIKVSEPDLYSLHMTAENKGAAALLIAGRNFPRPPAPRQGPLYIQEQNEEKPDAFVVSDSVVRLILGKDYRSVRKSLRAGKSFSKTYPVDIQLDMKKSHNQLESSNVIGYIEGTDKKEEAVIITAHYDHLGKFDSVIYYGADDDGTGTVTVLQLARAFAKAAADSARPRRNIFFMTVSGEEEGLWGSDFYSENPAFPLEKTSVDLNVDMIGRIEGRLKSPDSLNYIYVVGDNRLSSDLRPISERVNNEHVKLRLDYKFNSPTDPERIYYRSDHYNFAKKGVPIIFYFNGLHKDYHRPTDTPDKINYDLLEKRARLIFYTAWEMANRDEMVKRDLP